MASATPKDVVIARGADNLERVYLYDRRFHADGQIVDVRKSFFPQADTTDVIMRHIGRYGFALPFIRPGYTILDFPCGSGLGLEAFDSVARFGNFTYEGMDLDEPTIRYAHEVYGKTRPWVQFGTQDLTDFTLPPASYDLTCCVEGIEHIPHEAQIRACEQFFRCLKPGGTLIMSSPPPENGVSGPNPRNEFHLWEMTRKDFEELLGKDFGTDNVEIVTQENLLSTGQWRTCFYAICHKR